jgi:hypothetical protein
LNDNQGGKFPMKVQFRHVTVKVYRKTPRCPFYRIAFRADGKRVVRNFERLGLAKAEAKKKAPELATLLKYKLHTDQDLFDKAYGYIRQDY